MREERKGEEWERDSADWFHLPEELTLRLDHR